MNIITFLILAFFIFIGLTYAKITSNGIAALTYCQENFILQGTLYQEKTILECLKNFKSLTSKNLQDDLKIFAEIFNKILNELKGNLDILNKNKISSPLYNWILKSFHYLIGQLFLEKFSKWSGDSDRQYIYERIKGYKIDLKRYKAFQKYLKETSENLDDLLYLKLGNKDYKKISELKSFIKNKIIDDKLDDKNGGPNAELFFWWIRPNNREELLAASQSRQSITNDPSLLTKSKSEEEKRLSNPIPIISKSPSSRSSKSSIWINEISKTRPSFTQNYLNNSKIYNGETTPSRLSFEEVKESSEIINNNNNFGIRKWSPKVRNVIYLVNSEIKEEEKQKQKQNTKQSKQNKYLTETKKDKIKKLNKIFRSVPITNLFSSPEDQSIEVAIGLNILKTLKVNYEPGFYKFIKGKSPLYSNCETIKQNNKGQINCDYFNERNNEGNDCYNILNPKKEINEKYFTERIEKVINCVLNYCLNKSKIQDKSNGLLRKVYKNLKKIFGSDDLKWWIGEDKAEHIVIVANSEVIGIIHKLITDQWIDVEPFSITKFIEFETNEASTSGPFYKKFKIIQESNIKHLGPIREELNVINNSNNIRWGI